MAKVNRIKYKDYYFEDGPDNFFTLPVGLRPGWGKFRATKETVDAIVTSQSTSGTLTFTDEDFEREGITDETKLGSVNLYGIWFVKAIPVDVDLYDVWMADDRITWYNKIGTANYNCYLPSRDVGISDYTLDSSTLNTGVLYTYQQVITALCALINANITATLPVSLAYAAPRQVLASGLPCIKALAELCNDLCVYITPEIDIANTRYNYTIHKSGLAVDTADMPDNKWILDSYLDTKINQSVSRGIHQNSIHSNEDSLLTGVSGSDLVVGSTGYNIFYSRRPYVAGTDMANEVTELSNIRKASLANNLWNEATYAGIHTLALGNSIQEITWKSNFKGAVTKIRNYRFEEEPFPELKNGLFNYGDWPIGSSSTAGKGVVGVVSAHNVSTGVVTVVRQVSVLDAALTSENSTSDMWQPSEPTETYYAWCHEFIDQTGLYVYLEPVKDSYVSYLARPLMRDHFNVLSLSSIPAGSVVQIMSKGNSNNLYYVQQPDDYNLNVSQLLYCPWEVATTIDIDETTYYSGYAISFDNRIVRVSTGEDANLDVGTILSTAPTTYALETDPIGNFTVIANEGAGITYAWVRYEQPAINCVRVVAAADIPNISVVQITSVQTSPKVLYTVNVPASTAKNMSDLLLVAASIDNGKEGLGFYNWNAPVAVRVDSDVTVGSRVFVKASNTSLFLDAFGPFIVLSKPTSTTAIIRYGGESPSTVIGSIASSTSSTVYTVTTYTEGDANISSVYIPVGVTLATGVKVGVVKEKITIDSTTYYYWGWPLDPYNALYKC